MKKSCMLLLFFLFLIGCTDIVKVAIHQDHYAATFSASDFGQYKGKTLYLSSFENRADNTFMWGYQSPNGYITYKMIQAYPLQSFYWYCFQKNFRIIGMALYDQAPPAGIPEFRFILKSLNDQEFKYSVTLLRDGLLIFEKDYIVTMPKAETEDPIELEKRVYELVNLAFIAIMKDQEFYQHL